MSEKKKKKRCKGDNAVYFLSIIQGVAEIPPPPPHTQSLYISGNGIFYRANFYL